MAETAQPEPEILHLPRESTEELLRIVEISGYHFKELAMPLVDEEHGSVAIANHEEASNLRACVVHNAGLSERLIMAHEASLNRIQRYNLPLPSNERFERINQSLQMCSERIRLAKEIGTQITKLFGLEEHEYLQDESPQL